jgi:hypothetical protein
MLCDFPLAQNVLAFRVAVIQGPKVEDFIKELVADNPPITSGPSCGNKGLTIKISTLKHQVEGDKGAPEDRHLVLSEDDLGFAQKDPVHTPIWPIIVRKLAQGIAKANAALNDAKLLMNVKGDEAYDCNARRPVGGGTAQAERVINKRQYLCETSDLVSRLLGIRLQSTGIVSGGTSPKDADLRTIFAGAKDNFAIVFEDWSPRYLVTSDADTNPGDDNDNAKDRKFHAVKLEIKKSGRSMDMHYQIDKIGEPGTYDYKHIMDGGDERDTHIVYKYGNFKKAA